MALEQCETNRKNMGVSQCNKLPGMPKTFFSTPLGFSIPEETAEDPDLLQAYLQDAMENPDPSERIYLWPEFLNFTDQSEAAVYVDTPLGKQLVRDGKYSHKYEVSQNLCLHRAMYTHRSRTGRVLIIDSSNQMNGTKKSDGSLMGYRVELLNTEKLKWNDGTNPSASPIDLTLKDNRELDQNGIMVPVEFYGELTRVTDVTIEIVSSIATKVVVNVFATCDGTPIMGLALADFIMLKLDGTGQTITSITEGADGQYSLNGTGLLSGTVELDTPDELSIHSYETPEAADFVIA